MDLEKTLLSFVTELPGIHKMWNQGVRQQHFIDPLNKAVWEFSVDYFHKTHMQNAPTVEVLQYEFPAFQVEVDKEESLDWLIQSIIKRYAKNQVDKLIIEVAKNNSEDPLKANNKLYTGAWEVKQNNTSRVQKSDLSENILERQERYAKAAEVKEDVHGIPIGIDEVDRHTYGLLKDELAVIAAYTKVGKTHMLCHAFVQMRKRGKTPYLATLELSKKDIEERLDAHLSGFKYEDIQRGNLSREDRLKLFEKQEEFKEYGSSFIEKFPRGERTIQQIVNTARQSGSDCVLIDQLSFLEGRKDYYKTEQEMIAELIHELKTEISEDESTAIPCFLTVQFNREAVKQKSGRGGLHHIGLSSRIEQTADIVYTLSQTREQRENRSLILDIKAFRRGPLKSWLLEWDLVEKTQISIRSEIETE